MADDKKTLELQIRIAADEALKAVSSLKGEMQSLAGEARKLSRSDGAAVTRTFQQTQAAADKAAASMKLFGASSGELRHMQAQLKSTAAELVTQGLDPQGDEIKNLVEEYKRLGKEADDLDKANGKNIGSFGDLTTALTRLAEVAALTKVLGIVKDMGAFALTTADTFQTARNEFGTLLGDMEAGAGLFNQIKAFNDKTPFSLDTLKQATNILLAAKVPLADLEKQLTKFGDLSQGNSQKFTSYINAFSKAAAKGKADMETLNTYLNQGVPILDALANRFDVTTEEIVEMTSQGKISFEDFSAALNDLTAEGGQYFGGMELGSQSLAAMQEGLKESVNSLAASFGDMLLPVALNMVKALTAITNAINDSPILKGLLAGALVALTGYLAAMAVKAGIAFAAQMSLNLAVGALNPVVMAATIAAGAAAVVYTAYATDLQNAARAAEDFALQTYMQKTNTELAAEAVQKYQSLINGFNTDQIRSELDFLNKNLNATLILPDGTTMEVRDSLEELLKTLGERRTAFIESMLATTDTAKIEKLNKDLAEAFKFLEDPGLTAAETSQLQLVIKNITDELNKLKGAADATDMDKKAAAWKKAWADVWKQFQAEQSGDPFALINLDEEKKKKDAFENYIRGENPLSENAAVLNQVSEYYAAQRSKKAKGIKDEEEKLWRDLSKTRLDDLAYEYDERLKNIDALEAQRVIAAGDAEEEIQAIRERFAALRLETEAQYGAEIAKVPLEEAKAAIVDWQATLADALSQGLLNLEWFSDEASVILGELAAQFLELSASAALGGFEEFGRALGEGEEAAESMKRALVSMAQQILRQLPMMFLQAGLQLIANGQWALGLGFIAAAGSSAIISGYVDGATKNAKGGVYDEYGKAAAAFARGGTFTNQIVDGSTRFRFASGAGFAPGIMGEAGPEAIVPLTRGPDGRLGVSTYGAASAGTTAVYIIIQNYTNEEVRTEESSDASGNQIRKIIIGAVKESIGSGEMDKPMASRYGLRAQGV
jgi:tape measure domain-containing protein